MAKLPQKFVVYHIASTMERRRFARLRDAQRLVEVLGPDYTCAHVEYYNTKVVHMVERVNLMSGKKYMEPSNTPNYCSPASEAYWSM
jgi:hypothetical protein